MTESHKKGCRRKGCIIPAASIALIIAILVGREVHFAFWAKPGSAVDYHAMAEELVASHQPTDGENGWDFLLEAIDRKLAFENNSEHARAFDTAYSFIRDPGQWDGDDQEFTTPQLREAAAVGLTGLREAGVWDLLDQLAESPRFIRPMPRQGNLLDFTLPELGQTRSLSIALGARMRVSHDAGDDADVAAAVVQGAALSRALMHQCFLIDKRAGIAIYKLVDAELRYTLVNRPMDEQSLAKIADALEQLTTIPPELPYQGGRLLMLDTIQWTHTDNGRGDGRLILSEMNRLANYTRGAQLSESSWVNLGSIAFPSKKQTTEEAEVIYTNFIKAAKSPRSQRNNAYFVNFAWLAKISSRQELIPIMVRSIASALRANDQFDAVLAGTRTMVAIERYKLKHGSPPKSLDDLVPTFLPSLPIDPFAADGKFIYRPLNPSADQHARDYILYSVGADETDDDGSPNLKDPTNAFRDDSPGTDFVFNLPRPVPDAANAEPDTPPQGP